MTEMNEWQMRGKDSSPEDTLKHIQAIYDRLGFKTSIEEFDSGVENCYSCRLTVDGPVKAYIGTNGKGMTRELCFASANGEMIERLSNRRFAANLRVDDDRYEELTVPYYPLYSPSDPDQPECMKRLKERIAATVKTPLFLQTPMDLTEKLLKDVAPVKLHGKFQTVPFYRPGKAEPVYLPYNLLNLFTGSNGMAAGNTYEEAMVEGISEILERYAQSIIADGGITPPEIPAEVIDRYPHIRRVIDQITKDPRYEVRVLDCSLEKKIPVVCGVIINKDTGHFGMRYGCQPNMAIALERVFTESMQGSTLENAANKNIADFHEMDSNRRVDKWNSMKVGSGRVTARLLMDQPDYPFVPWEDVEGKTNREIMHSMIALLEDLGAEVFIRDASYLGFPSVYIYASGISEVMPVDIIHLKQAVLTEKVQSAFLHLESLTEDEVCDIENLAKLKTGAILENTIAMMSGLYNPKPMPGAPFEAEFLHAACSYQLGNVAEASRVLRNIARNASYMEADTAGFTIACDIYLDGLASGGEEEQVFSVVKRLCPKYADRIRDVFSDRTKTLSRLYPSGKGKEPTEIDSEAGLYPAIHDFYAKLVREEVEHPVDPAEFIQVLER